MNPKPKPNPNPHPHPHPHPHRNPNQNELSRWCKATAGFSGNVGSAEAPVITRFVSQTWDRDDPGWSRYDTLELHFDIPTDLGGREGGKDYVDTLLSFSDPLGADSDPNP